MSTRLPPHHEATYQRICHEPAKHPHHHSGRADPVFYLFFSHPSTPSAIIAAVIFLVASLTDLLDGYLARRRKEVTQFGKFLDPVADKLLIVSALILLVANGRVPAWMAIVIVGRNSP